MLSRQDVSKSLCENLKKASEYPINSKECLNAIEQCMFLIDSISEIKNNLERDLSAKKLQFKDYFYRKLQDNLIQRVRVIEEQSPEHQGNKEKAIIQILRNIGADIENCGDLEKIQQIRQKFINKLRVIIYKRYLDIFNNKRYGVEPEPIIEPGNNQQEENRPGGLKKQVPVVTNLLSLNSLLKQEIQNKRLNLGEILVKYIEEDPDNVLKKCYPNSERINSSYDAQACNCQVILEMYLLRLPHLNPRQIGEELGGIHRQTIESRLKICKEIIGEVAKKISNKLDELESKDSNELPLVTYKKIFQELKVEGIIEIIQNEI